MLATICSVSALLCRWTEKLAFSAQCDLFLFFICMAVIGTQSELKVNTLEARWQCRPSAHIDMIAIRQISRSHDGFLEEYNNSHSNDVIVAAKSRSYRTPPNSRRSRRKLSRTRRKFDNFKRIQIEREKRGRGRGRIRIRIRI